MNKVIFVGNKSTISNNSETIQKECKNLQITSHISAVIGKMGFLTVLISVPVHFILA